MKKYLFVFFFLFSTSLFPQEEWKVVKDQTLLTVTNLQGWCSKEKAELIMEVIKKNKCQICVEIGVFAGASLFPIAKTLQYNGSGIVYGIDAWRAEESVKGFITSDKHYLWWNKLDYNCFYKQALDLVIKHHFQSLCQIIRLSSQEAVSLFPEDCIDFIHFDGNISEEGAFRDVVTYLPKVKEGGYILLNNADGSTLAQTVAYLLERTELISPPKNAPFLLFQKNKEKWKQSTLLFVPKSNTSQSEL